MRPNGRGGRWAIGHDGAEAAIRRADAVIGLSSADTACVTPLLRTPGTLRRLAPFIDTGPVEAEADHGAAHHASLATRLGLEREAPVLLAVAMMRDGDKLASYRVLAAALARLTDEPWTLVVAGDGPARRDVEAEFAGFAGGRVHFIGAVEAGGLPALYAAADIYVWPAVREAFGIAILEAQAAGLPVVAGDAGGGGATSWPTARPGCWRPKAMRQALPRCWRCCCARAITRPPIRRPPGGRRRPPTVSTPRPYGSTGSCTRPSRRRADDPSGDDPARPDRLERGQAHPGPCRSRVERGRARGGRALDPARRARGPPVVRKPAIACPRDRPAARHRAADRAGLDRDGLGRVGGPAERGDPRPLWAGVRAPHVDGPGHAAPWRGKPARAACAPRGVAGRCERGRPAGRRGMPPGRDPGGAVAGHRLGHDRQAAGPARMGRRPTCLPSMRPAPRASSARTSCWTGHEGGAARPVLRPAFAGDRPPQACRHAYPGPGPAGRDGHAGLGRAGGAGPRNRRGAAGPAAAGDRGRPLVQGPGRRGRAAGSTRRCARPAAPFWSIWSAPPRRTR